MFLLIENVPGPLADLSARGGVTQIIDGMIIIEEARP